MATNPGSAPRQRGWLARTWPLLAAESRENMPSTVAALLSAVNVRLVKAHRQADDIPLGKCNPWGQPANGLES